MYMKLWKARVSLVDTRVPLPRNALVASFRPATHPRFAIAMCAHTGLRRRICTHLRERCHGLSRDLFFSERARRADVRVYMIYTRRSLAVHQLLNGGQLGCLRAWRARSQRIADCGFHGPFRYQHALGTMPSPSRSRWGESRKRRERGGSAFKKRGLKHDVGDKAIINQSPDEQRR